MSENQKKKPGRPRKIPEIRECPRHGITKKPNLESNAVEMVYDTPMVLKRMVYFMKAMAVDKVQIIFNKECIIFWALDHHVKNKIKITLDGSKLNHYYCKEAFDIGLSCEDLELVLSKIDKTYSAIAITSKEGYTQKNLNIRLKNELMVDEIHIIELVGTYSKIQEEYNFRSDLQYTLHFTLPCKYFKKMISDIKSFSNVLSICQHEKNESVKIEYSSRNKKIKSYNVIGPESEIKFLTDLKGNDSFRITAVVDYIKPISGSCLSSSVDIHCKESKPILFVMKTEDLAFEARVLTDIEDDRIS